MACRNGAYADFKQDCVNQLFYCKITTQLEKPYYLIYNKINLIHNKEVINILSIQQKIEMACTVSEITKTELAKRLGMTQPAFSQRLKTGKFSDDDFKNIASAIGAEYFSGFKFPDGTIIE